MSIKKMSVVLGVLLIASMVLTACPAPQPQVVEKVVTQIVEQKVEVVQTQIVEKTVEKTVEKVVVATAVPEAKPALLRINLGTYPDVIDPQKSSYVNEIAHLKLIYEGLTKFNEELETVPGAGREVGVQRGRHRADLHPAARSEVLGRHPAERQALRVRPHPQHQPRDRR